MTTTTDHDLARIIREHNIQIRLQGGRLEAYMGQWVDISDMGPAELLGWINRQDRVKQ